jgi:NADH:ubiquinone oxidoreductase subunit F (NADH-binding)
MSALEEMAPDRLPRLLAGLKPHRQLSLGEHLAQHGPIALGERRSLFSLLEGSGLGGRGGAGFPTARKLHAVAGGRGRPIVLVNATEGEPLSDKDKALLRHVPHLVIDGAVLLAAELRTREVVLAIAETAHAELAAIASALVERRSRQHDGRIRIEVVTVPDRFVAGEETALVQYLNGGPALPTFGPPRPFERGIGKRPTLVQNAETVAHVGLIARYGPGWFRQVGTESEPGSALFTLSGAVRRPGVLEAELGVPVRELVARAGGLTQRPRALLIGGYFGTWFDAADAAALTLDDACLNERGGSLGARAIAVLPEEACGLCETVQVAEYLAQESAGQCGPCVNGLAALAGGLQRLAKGSSGNEAGAIKRWARQVQGRGACRHPDGAARFIASAIDVFAAEIDHHRNRGRCPHPGVRLLHLPAQGPT